VHFRLPSTIATKFWRWRQTTKFDNICAEPICPWRRFDELPAHGARMRQAAAQFVARTLRVLNWQTCRSGGRPNSNLSSISRPLRLGLAIPPMLLAVADEVIE
jgi:hypothetical protein